VDDQTSNGPMSRVLSRANVATVTQFSKVKAIAQATACGVSGAELRQSDHTDPVGGSSS